MQLCDDFMPLAQFTTRCFAFKAYGDEVNLWYVAVTRPRRTLAFPRNIENNEPHHFMKLMNAFAMMRAVDGQS